MVLFKILGGQVRPDFEMPFRVTIGGLKERIKTELGLEVGRQTLVFSDRDLEDDSATFSSYFFSPAEEEQLPDFTDIEGLVVNICLTVKPLPDQPKFKILVKSSTKEDEMNVRETYTVGELKKKIERKWGISEHSLTLFRLDKEMDDDNLPLSQYYVCEGSLIEVKVKVDPR